METVAEIQADVMETDWINQQRGQEPCELMNEHLYNEEGPFSAVIDNHLVMDHILSYLDTNSIMVACLVSKACCNAGRVMMRKRNVLAVVKGSHPCKQLLRLNSVVKSSSDLPFLGISFQILKNKMHPWGPCQMQGSVTEVFPMLAKMDQACMEVNCDTNQHCLAVGLMKQLLKEQRKTITRILLTGLPESYVSLMEFVGYNGNDFLQNLAAIKASNSSKRVMQAALELTLNCKRIPSIESAVSCEQLTQLAQGQKLLATKAICVDVVPIEDEFSGDKSTALVDCSLKFAPGAARLQKLIIKGSRLQLAHLSILRTLPVMSTNLVELHINFNILFRMLCTTTGTPLDRIQRLRLEFCYGQCLPIRLPNLQIDWTRCLPMLQTVTFMFKTGSVDCGPIPSRVLDGAAFSPCLTATDICIDEVEKLWFGESHRYFPIQNLESLAVVFPRVTRLRINNVGTRIRAIFPYLYSLKKLVQVTLLRVNVTGIKFNMDNILCGISIPEANQMMRLSPEEIQEQVSKSGPHSAGLLGLKDLRYLLIQLEHPTRETGAHQYPFHHKFFLTHVTGQLVFKGMQDLSVAILRQTCGDNCRYWLKQLEPYVSMHETIGQQRKYLSEIVDCH